MLPSSSASMFIIDKKINIKQQPEVVCICRNWFNSNKKYRTVVEGCGNKTKAQQGTCFIIPVGRIEQHNCSHHKFSFPDKIKSEKFRVSALQSKKYFHATFKNSKKYFFKLQTLLVAAFENQHSFMFSKCCLIFLLHMD